MAANTFRFTVNGVNLTNYLAEDGTAVWKELSFPLIER